MNKLKTTILALVSLGLATYSQTVTYSDSVLAQVGDEVITSFEVQQQTGKFEEQLRQRLGGQELVKKIVELRETTLTAMIERELIYMDFKSLKAAVPPLLIQERLDEIIKAMSGGDAVEFENHLNTNEKMTMTELKEKLRKDIAIELLRHERTSKGISIPDSAIDGYYKENHMQFTKPRRYNISVILLSKSGRYKDKVMQTSSEISGKIIAGESFGELAKKYSEGANAENGGEQGWMVRVNEQLLEVINKMEPGQTWPRPIDLGNNVYFLHINDIEGGGVPELDANLRKTIKDIIQKDEEKKRYDKYIKELYMKYPVKRIEH